MSEKEKLSLVKVELELICVKDVEDALRNVKETER